jgi:hypothetical protein
LLLLSLALVSPANAAAEDEEGPAPDDPLAPPDEAPAAPFALSVGAGYAFRPSLSDSRNHGGAGTLYGDIPLLWDFALRVEGGALAWGGAPERPTPLVRGYAAPSLVYSFDDTEVTALIGIGGFFWAELDVDDPQPPPVLAGGVLGSLVARWPLFDGLRGELGIRLPFVLYRSLNPPTDLFPLTVMATAGVTFVPGELF